jgi:hypothetical protein
MVGWIQNQRNIKYISHFGWKFEVVSKVGCIRKSKNCHIHLSFLWKSDVASMVWMRSKSKKSITSPISHFGWKSDVVSKVGCIRKSNKCQIHIYLWWKPDVASTIGCIRKSEKCQIHLSRWMEVRSRLKGWMHSNIKEMLNTSIILDGSLMSLQRFDAFENHINVTYIFHLREVRRRCNAWIYRIRNKSDANAAADFDELEMIALCIYIHMCSWISIRGASSVLIFITNNRNSRTKSLQLWHPSLGGVPTRVLCTFDIIRHHSHAKSSLSRHPALDGSPARALCALLLYFVTTPTPIRRVAALLDAPGYASLHLASALGSWWPKRLFKRKSMPSPWPSHARNHPSFLQEKHNNARILIRPTINALLNTYANVDGCQIPIPGLNASTNERITKYIRHSWLNANANSKVKRIKNLWFIKCVCHFSTDVKCHFRGWMHAKINELSSTSATSDGHPMPTRRVKACEKYICHVFMDVKCQCRGRTHSHINELLNTSATFDGHQMPIQRLKTFTYQRIAEYICHFWWTSSANSKVEDIQKSTTC